jgi:hypothetical protein
MTADCLSCAVTRRSNEDEFLALRPGGLDPFALTRTNAVTEFGVPHRADTSWHRWDRDDVAWHITWGDDGNVQMLTLMWRPALPSHLR